MIRALRRRGPAALGAGLAAVLVAATACGGDDGSASASGGGKVALTVNVFGNFGYETALQAVRGRPSEHHDHRAGHRLGPVQLHAGADQEPCRRQRCRGRGRPRRGHHDPVQGAAAELRRPRPVRRQRRQGQLPALEVRRRPVLGRQQAHRPRHRRRRRWRMCYRTRPVRQGRPADRPRRGRQALAELGRLRRPSASSSRPRTPARSAFDAASNTYNTILVQSAGKDPGYTYFDKSNALVIDSNPAIKQAYDRIAGDDRRRAVGRLQVVLRPVERRLQEGHVRDDRLPGLDDSATSRARPVTATRASGTSPRCPAAAATGAAPASRCRRRASTPRRRPSWSEFLTSPQGQIAAFKAVGNLPSIAGGPGGPGAAGVRPTRTSTTRRSARSSAPAPSSCSRSTSARRTRPVRDAVENALRGRANRVS